jgi:hypothetical protein
MDERELPREESLPGKPHKIVHLRRADLDKPEIAASWHSRGYATLGPMEGHDPYIRCPICSTGEDPPEKPECPYCGPGPCFFARLLKRSD